MKKRIFACAMSACDSRGAPNLQDGRQIVAKRLRRWWRPGPGTYLLLPTASCDLQGHAIHQSTHRTRGLRGMSLLRFFAGQAREELAFALFAE